MAPNNSTVYCQHGTPMAVLPSVQVVVGITCVLSMFGAVLIILSYLLIKEIRTKAREILVHLSFMDFMVATANFVGVVVNFDQYLLDTHHVQYSERTYNIVNTLCVTQASFALYGTESSILWTIAIAVYIYFRVMFDQKPVARRAVYAFYVICYGLPLIMTLWYSLEGKLGYSRYGGSGWCSFVLKRSKDVYPMTALLGSDMWLYLTIILVPVIFVSLYFYLRFEVKNGKTYLTPNLASTVQSVERKLIFIPIIFILLRIWSLLFTIIDIEAPGKLSCPAVEFFLHMGGIGDSGQGFANAILFCLLTPKVRRYFLRHLCCCCCCCCCRRRNTLEEEDALNYSTTKSTPLCCCLGKNTLEEDDAMNYSTSKSTPLYGSVDIPNSQLSDDSQDVHTKHAFLNI